MRMVQTWGESELAEAAERALGRVRAVLPEDRQHLVQATPLFAPGHFGQGVVKFDIAGLRHPIREQRLVRISYVDFHGAATERTLRPLAMAFFGQVWLLTAWCKLREDFRAFRPDRIQSLEILEKRFPDEPGKRLEDYVVCRAAEAEAQ
ncbi:MAG: putative DNA-binding transcriptional regulator YafY [Planctomycetota bacterium]|jgi:predicted DNA-binding transcriptional regulator YafY